ncbi:MAG: glycosyltransferase family 4 protein [Candidatus Thiodiazotropha endolucinida]
MDAKVCFVTPEFPPTTGGVATSSDRIVQYLLASGLAVDVFTASPFYSNDVRVRKDTMERLTVYEIGTNRDQADHVFSNIIADVDLEKRFDVFHAFFLPLGKHFLPLLKNSDRPFIASARGSDAMYWMDDKYQGQSIRDVLMKASVITSVSNQIAVKIQNAIPRKDCKVIPNGVKQNEGIEWHPNNSNRGIVGTLCAIRPVKNIPHLIRSYSYIDKDSRRKLRILGFYEGSITSINEQRALIERRARVDHVQTELEITGLIGGKKKINELLGLGAFVLCSKWEGFPNSLLEAASLGIPIVATDIGAVSGILTHGTNALIAPPKDPFALAKNIRKVLVDKSLSLKLSEGALNLAKKYDYETELESWRDLYSGLLN